MAQKDIEVNGTLRSFIIVFLTSGAAGVIWHFGRGRLRLPVWLVVAPLPASLFVLLSGISYPDAPAKEHALGLTLSVLICYISAWSGCAAAWMADRARLSKLS